MRAQPDLTRGALWIAEDEGRRDGWPRALIAMELLLNGNRASDEEGRQGLYEIQLGIDVTGSAPPSGLLTTSSLARAACFKRSALLMYLGLFFGANLALAFLA